jgi:protein unc-80
MQQIQSPNYFNNTYISLEGKTERDIIMQLAITIRTMVHNCELLSKSYNGPYRNSPEHKGSSQRNQCSRGIPQSPGFDFEEESHSKYVKDFARGKNIPELTEDSELVRTEYRRARDVLLSLVGEFLNRANTRLQELARKPGAESKYLELLDVKCHIRLADIAHSLLKVSPYDPESMACRGLQRYMTFILPRAEWADEKMKNSLVTILRRLDKVFLKISKKPSIRRNTDWEAAAGLLKGIHETIVRCPFVLHWQQMKSLLSTVQNLIVNETPLENVSSASAALMSQSPPAFFCSTVVRLISLQLVCHVDCFTLEQVCGGTAEFSTQEKAEGFLMNLLMPLCLKICSGRGISEVGELKDNDISFLVTVILNSMSPPSGRTAQSAIQGNRVVSDIRAGSLTFTGSRDSKRPAKISSTLYQAAFLALKVLSVCFESRLSNEWPRIARIMRDLGRRNEAITFLLGFLEFVVTHRTPLYIVLMPFILHKISLSPIGDHERHMQFLIRERLRGLVPRGGVKSKGCLLLELARELKDLKDELEERRIDKENTASSEPTKKESSIITNQPMEITSRSQQRPSLISILTGAGSQHPPQISMQHDSKYGPGNQTPSDTLSQQTLHPPRESLSSSPTTTNKDHAISNSYSVDGTTPTPTYCTAATIISRTSSIRRPGKYESQNISGSVPHLPHSLSLHQHANKAQPPKLRFVSSVEFRDSAGETSTTPLSPNSPAEDSSSENHKHRLQRSKGQSRKTFRYKRGRLNQNDANNTPLSAPPIQMNQTIALSNSSQQQPQHSFFHVPALDTNDDVLHSWDSVSQTSSTSGYRDNYSFQTGLLSPDGSLNFNETAIENNVSVQNSSQNSLLMLFETQDEEDTLI